MPQRTKQSAALPKEAEDRLAVARKSGYIVLGCVPGPGVARELAARVAELCGDANRFVDDTGGTIYLTGLEYDPIVYTALTHPTLMATLDALLGQVPTLVSARFRSPKPGGGAQALHRDEPYPETNGDWLSATVIIGLTEFTAANGATRIVPGSHLSREPFISSSATYQHPTQTKLTGGAGASYIFTGACLHSGTENTSTLERPALQATFRRSCDVTADHRLLR